MELGEVGRRIFRRHWRLILLCVGVAVVAAGIGSTVLGGGHMYTASARFVLDTPDPKSRSEAQSIADMAKGLATSPALVRDALERAGADRSAVDVAKSHVAVTSLGTSAVLQLSVSDRDRRVAAALANALAQRVIEARLAFSNGRLQQALSDLKKKIDELNVKIAALDVQADSLAVRLAGATSAAQSSDLRAERDQLLQSRDLFVQQRGAAESERVSLIAAGVANPSPEIISRASVPAAADSSRLPSYLVLGILLGLIVGIALAAILELMRPTLVGGDAIARELGVAYLGSLPKDPLARAPQLLSTLRIRLRLAANAAEVRTIGVVPMAEDADLTYLAAALGRDPAARLSVRQVAIDDTSRAEGGIGLLAIGPTELEKEKVENFAQFLALTPQPVLGLVTYDRESANNPQHEPDSTSQSARPVRRRVRAKEAGRLVRRLSRR